MVRAKVPGWPKHCLDFIPTDAVISRSSHEETDIGPARRKRDEFLLYLLGSTIVQKRAPDVWQGVVCRYKGQVQGQR